MKTDTQLKRDVESELGWDPAIDAARIGVAVKDGVVTLSGHIDTYAERFAAEKALRRVSGVKAIALELDVSIAPQHQRSDTDIALAVERALLSNVTLPADRIRATVERGWVTLRGEVEWQYQRNSAETGLRALAGVVGISNDIAISARIAPADVKARIAEALQRQARREADHVDVSVDGSTVTLHGKVHSWHERDAAAGVAWSAPGVRAVINNLQIG